MENERALRDHLLELLASGHAHLDFEKAIAGLPAAVRGAKPPGLPFTPWRLVEHMRIAQWDILQFSINPHHISPDFPEGYWPTGDGPTDSSAWDGSITEFRADLKSMMDLISDPATDLFKPLAAWSRTDDPSRSIVGG